MANLSRHSYSAFIVEFFSANGEEEGHEGFYPLTEAGEDVFYQPLLDSYGGSIHRVYLLHFPPWQLFHTKADSIIDDPVLGRRLARIRNLYKDEVGYWGMVDPCLREGRKLHRVGFITNFAGIERKVYDEFLIPSYQRLKRRYGLKKPPILLGSCDSFIDLAAEKAQRIFARFVDSYQEGIAIKVSEEKASVDGFATESWLSSGLLPGSKGPYEPAFVSYSIRNRAILAEFEALINNAVPERDLEDSLVTNYQAVFGLKYDRIETQLWLRFPTLDAAGRNRRLDVFLRDAVRNDWELVEIKRPIKLSRTYRDAPILAAEVQAAIQQVKNYARMLNQDKVKRQFARAGIVYYEPTLSIVIGRNPQIPIEQWQWLRRSNEDRVRITTFDDLLMELRFRLDERMAVLETLTSDGLELK